MIGTIKIKINAEHPNIDLTPIYTFRLSASNLRIIDIPRKIGNWNISNVTVEVSYPNGYHSEKNAVQTCGCWVCTIDGSDTIGKGTIAIKASGSDENGISKNYVLGRGSYNILDDNGEINIGDNRYTLRLVDDTVTDFNIGDCRYNSNTKSMQYYNGNIWIDFTDLSSTKDRLDYLRGQISNVANEVSYIGDFLSEVYDDVVDLKEDRTKIYSDISNLSAIIGDIDSILERLK